MRQTQLTPDCYWLQLLLLPLARTQHKGNVQQGTARYSTVQHRTARYSTVQQRTARHSKVQQGHYHANYITSAVVRRAVVRARAPFAMPVAA
jgi:hypothetical protein